MCKINGKYRYGESGAPNNFSWCQSSHYLLCSICTVIFIGIYTLGYCNPLISRVRILKKRIISHSDSTKKGTPIFEWQLQASAEAAEIPVGDIKSGLTYDHVIHLNGTLHTNAVGLKGGRLLASLVQITSGQPSANYIGDMQTASNISAQPSFRIYELSYTQDLPGRFVAAVGLIDMNKFFVRDDHASTLLNSSFGIGPDISDNVPVSIYPKPGLGISFAKYFPHWKLQASLFQNNPDRRNSINLKKNMATFEADYKTDNGIGRRPIMLKGGIWHHTKVVSVPGTKPHSDWGYYLIAQQSLYESGPRSAGVFLQWGSCPVNHVEVPYYMGLGLLINDPFHGRPQDQFSMGIAKAWVNRQLTDAETAYEVTYVFQAIQQISLQPDIQYIEHPSGMEKRYSIACFLRLNLEID